MNIGIDYDNTITTNPIFFKEFVSSLVKEDSNTIYIISSCAKIDEPMFDEIHKRKSAQLKEWGIPFRKLELALEPIPENKTKLCKAYGIDLMIDDDMGNISEITRNTSKTVCLQFISRDGNPGDLQ